MPSKEVTLDVDFELDELSIDELVDELRGRGHYASYEQNSMLAISTFQFALQQLDDAVVAQKAQEFFEALTGSVHMSMPRRA